jgi:hypothetical protein
MRNTQAVKKFLTDWRSASLPSKEILHSYRPLCRNLMYEDEDVVTDVTDLLRKNIESWAELFSPAYSEKREFISKAELEDKEKWYVESVMDEAQPMATSGSTTGCSFRYMRWEPFLYFIEGLNHYDLILDEFQVTERPKILYLFNSGQYEKEKLITVRFDSSNFMEHHGTSRKAEVHYANFEMMERNHKIFFGDLVSYLSKNPMDVIFAPGPSINSMCHYIKKHGAGRICGLLSNSNERILPDDASFMLDGHADHVCDHMRCWDGGATFFTCKHLNYHLLDNLSWCEESEGKLLSTDYFSLPSPFVRYWNGDFCSIENEYKRCECGRLYREFEFLENRPFSMKGTCFKDIRRAIEKINSNCIKQVRCGLNTIDIISSEEIPEHQKGEISKTADRFEFKFIVED